ncbi:ABC transporter permease [Candidatus Bipolaricaulota bacterium]|nr:ABC transporter permease [Candidatus Bipolaricaulota bacterium]
MIDTWIVGTLSRALAFGTPLLLATLGEIYAERSGVLNLGVEGMMIIGAFSAFATAFITGNPWLGMLVAAVAGGFASLLHAFVSVTLRANQVVSGLALTMLGLGLSGLFGKGFEGKPLDSTIPNISVPILERIPYLGEILFVDQNPFVYFGLALAPILWFILFKTSAGITIRSVGENPAAVDSVGINVWKVRYLCVFLGGLMAGIAGGYLSIAYRPAWRQGLTGGMGWLVIALTIFSSWNPKNSLIGAYFFGILIHLSYRLQPWVSPELLNMIHYMAAILALAVLSLGPLKRRLGEPSSLTQPYIRGEKH